MLNNLTKLPRTFFINAKIKAVISVGIILLAFAFVPILVRLGEREMSFHAVIFNRFWISSVILSVWSGQQAIKTKLLGNLIKPSPSLSFPLVILLLGAGLSFTVVQVFWAWSLTQTSIANSALFHSFTPLFTTFLGWLLLSQKFDNKFLIGLMIAIAGSIITGIDDFVIEISKIQGDINALISAFFLAFYLLLVEKLRKELNTSTILLSSVFIGTLAILPIQLIKKEEIFPHSTSGWLAVIGLAFLFILSFGLITQLLHTLSSGFIALTILLDPVLAAFLGWVIFSETLDLFNLLAFPVILLGIYLGINSESAIVSDDLIQEH